VTDGSEQNQEAELARQAEALREQGMPIFRALQKYLTATPDDPDVLAVARQVSEAIGLGTAEVAEAVQNVREVGWVNVGGHVIVGPHVAVEARAVLDADTITLSESASVLRLVGIGELATKASRSGIAGLSTAQVLVLVLLWLLAIGAPVVQKELPPEAQALLSNEYGTIGIAIALTLVVFNRQR
jgi:hypothetical protein